MNNLEKAQLAYDNRTPDDDAHAEFVEEQVELLMSGDDARDVTQDEFLEELDELLACGEFGSAAEVILAVMNGEANMAKRDAGKMASQFEKVAKRLIEGAQHHD